MDLIGLETGDDLGPVQVVVLRDPRVGLDAVVVVDNISCGPAIGGVRVALDVTGSEVARLARAMTLKNAAAGLSHGGGKAGIVGDPNSSLEEKERLLRAFAVAIRDLRSYIPGPDMGTDETCMAWVHDEIGRCVGLPAALGGIPLDELGATGFGLAVCAEALESAGRLTLRGARVVIHGFGAVGRHAARFLVERGALVVAVGDTSGGLVDRAGIDIARLITWKAEGRGVAEFPGGERCSLDALVGLDCEIWIPAARPDTITSDNAADLRAGIVLEGANIPTTPDAERLLHDRGVLVIPDFVANAGGVICAAVEHQAGTRSQAFASIDEKIRSNTLKMLSLAEQRAITPRAAAEEMARARIDQATSYRRRF